jgi:hypothetical protein
MASANSYGGINTSEVYLQPKVGNTSAQGSSQSEANGGSSSGSTVNGSGGGNTGGGSESVTPVTVAAPQFTGDTQFSDTTQVSMSAESGASIYYTLDGSTPTSASTVYSAPITLSDTTTVKAIAIKDGVSSTVSSRTYTKQSGNGGGNDVN